MREGATSGLVRYLFGDDLSGSLTKEHFVKLQSDLIDDVLEMEFTRYVDSTEENISETDFCRHLLYSSSISQKRKEKMIIDRNCKSIITFLNFQRPYIGHLRYSASDYFAIRLSSL